MDYNKISILKNTNPKIIDIDFGKLYCFDKQNMFVFNFEKNTILSLDVVTLIYDKCNIEAGGKKYFLCTIMSTNITPTIDAYNFYSSNNRTEHIVKEAFVLNGGTLKLAANFYFKVKKPAVKGMAFNNENDAVDWLLNEAKDRVSA